MATKSIPGGVVLRIGILQGRQLMDERMFRRLEDVTVGQSRKNHISLATDAVPRSFVLFEATATSFGLVIADTMDGRISFGGDEVLAFAQVLQSDRAKKREDGLWFVPLGQKSRGKVLIGTNLTLLFQFVPAPPAVARAQIPPSLRVPLRQKLDMALLVILMISMSAHLGFAGYVSNLPAPKPPAVEEVPDRFVKLLVPKRPKPPEKQADSNKPGEDPNKRAKEKKAAAKAIPRPREVAVRKESDPESAHKVAEERRARLREQVSKTGILKILGAKGESGGAIENLIGKGAPATDQDSAFAGLTGVTGGGRIKSIESAKSGTGRAATIDDMRGGGVKEGGGTGGKVEREVKGVARQERANVDGELDQAQVMGEIRKRNGAIKRCYERGLKKNQSLRGKVTVRFVITLAGTVSQASLSEDEVGDSEVSSCILSSVRGWRFPAPQGGTATVEVPFVFAPSE